MSNELCVSLSFATYDTIPDFKNEEFDILEWRIDSYQEPNIREVNEYLYDNFKGKLLITFRSECNNQAYYQIVKDILTLKMDIIDLEYNSLTHEQLISLINLAKQKNIEVLLSYHNFKTMLAKQDFIELTNKMAKYSVAYLKIIMSGTKKDLPYYYKLNELLPRKIATTFFLMGEEVIETRLANNDQIIFTYLDQPTAKGQLSFRAIKKKQLLKK